MIRTYIIDEDQKLTEAQLREIEEAKKMPITFDEDSPELTPTMYNALRNAVIQRNRRLNA